MLTKKQFENSLFVIKLLEKIIRKGLLYDQNVRYQVKNDYGKLTDDFDALVASKEPACLMGWLVTQKYAKKNGFVLADTKTYVEYFGDDGAGAFAKFVGFSCHDIVAMSENKFDAEKALEYFKEKFYVATLT